MSTIDEIAKEARLLEAGEKLLKAWDGASEEQRAAWEHAFKIQDGCSLRELIEGELS